MEKKVTIQIDADFKKKVIPLPLIVLLPPIAERLLIIINRITKNGKKFFYSSKTPKLFHMNQEECDIALQTLIDNGIVNVVQSGDWYQCLVNYDSFKDFTYEITDLYDKEDIKLSTDVTFRNITDDSCSIDELTDEQMNEITIDQFKKFQERFYSLQKKKEMVEEDSLFDAKERQREAREEMARECFLLSKKNVGKVSE